MARKAFKRPKRSEYIERAIKLVEELGPLLSPSAKVLGFSNRTILELLKRSLAEYSLQFDALAFIAEHLTTDEGDRKATSDAFGLDASEVVEMAHDEMIIKARLALPTKRSTMSVYDKPIIKGVPLTPKVEQLFRKLDSDQLDPTIMILNLRSSEAHLEWVKDVVTSLAKRKGFECPEEFATELLQELKEVDSKTSNQGIRDD